MIKYIWKLALQLTFYVKLLLTDKQAQKKTFLIFKANTGTINHMSRIHKVVRHYFCVTLM